MNQSPMSASVAGADEEQGVGSDKEKVKPFVLPISKRVADFFLGDSLLGVQEVGQKVSHGFERPDSSERKITVGICAMSKKALSKPMKEILQRLEHFERLHILVFQEDIILNEAVENWPIVDVLISFYSHGFRLDKAIEYNKLRKPYVINDLEMQCCLRDRREVYKILMQEGIAHPRYVVLNRDGKDSPSTVVETEDSIEVDGHIFQKPFVEKPVDAEDHNVNIFFPIAAGGGSTRLFRKVKDRSSFYSPMCRVRKSGSFIYEDFMATDGTDVKVYTVGPDYAHAEARKSPALDGKVERDIDGKEIRYPVLLSAQEKMIAKKVCLAFKQNVCGFDLLRASGQSYVCDVNGFSFVKTSSKYYDDCAKILGTMIMRALAPQLQLPWVLGAAPEDIPVVPTTSGQMMELRCVSAVIRHGDRTPKQKMKMEVKHKKFFELFEKYGGFRSSHLKLKKPKQLQEVLDIVRHLLIESQIRADPEVEEKKAKLQQLKLVLEMYGHFSGINRKVQLKHQPKGRPKRSSSEEDETPREPSLVLIVKWGGELTPAGKIQAEDLGKAFRTLYPGGQGQFESPGLGFLRLHSTFRHDLKIYASDEGRVQMTAAAFAKGLLALEGELTPILIQMVKSANNNGLLDSEGKTSKYQIVVKEKLKDIFNQDRNFTDSEYEKLAPTASISLLNAMKFVKNPRAMCARVHEMIQEITIKIRALKLELKTRDLKLYHGESWELLIRRWAKLEKDFKMKNGRYDISKIPDIYDCIKYDLQHNQKTLQYERSEELFMCSKALADIVIPQEYGITVEEKLHIAQNYSTPLMRKMRSDLLQCLNHHSDDDPETTRLDSRYSKGVASPERFVRTRLYFTSESHIHSLLTMLRYGGLCNEMQDDQWKRAMDFVSASAELNYMTQIVLMMFEDPSKDPASDERFHIELHFSPGAYTCCDTGLTPPRGMGYRPNPKSDKKETKQGGGIQGSSSWQSDTITPSVPKLRITRSEPESTIIEGSEVGELQEADVFSHGSDTGLNTNEKKVEPEKLKKSVTIVPEPKSPDPNVPEWDWGGDDGCVSSEEGKPAGAGLDSSNKSDEMAVNISEDKTTGSTVKSKPIEIIPPSSSSLHCRLSENGKLQSLDETRSRSLEDKNSESVKDPAYVPRHYKTVHLPLASDRHYHSFSSLFYLNPEAFKAFSGFGMVPSLHPLETLHNALTFKDMDEFLGRATTTKFVTPVSSPPYGSMVMAVLSPRPVPGLPLPVSRVNHSLPSSSNSSAGPSSPTSASTPIDIMQKLRMFMDSQQEAARSDADTDSSGSSQQKKDSGQSDSNNETSLQ